MMNDAPFGKSDFLADLFIEAKDNNHSVGDGKSSAENW
jgi:hypothetical protein